MRIKATKKKSRLLLGVLLLSILGSAPLAAGKEGPEARKRGWRVKYQSGWVPINSGTKLRLRIGDGRILLEPKRGTGYSIPVDSVKLVAYDQTSRNLGFNLLTWSDDYWVAAIKSDPRRREVVKVRDAVMTLLSPGLLAGSAVLAPFNRKKHYMHIYWKDEGTGDKKWAVFKVPGSRRRALLGELANVTEKEWKHLPRERKELLKRRKKLRKERKKEERNAIPIRLKGQLSVIDGVEIVEP